MVHELEPKLINDKINFYLHLSQLQHQTTTCFHNQVCKSFITNYFKYSWRQKQLQISVVVGNYVCTSISYHEPTIDGLVFLQRAGNYINCLLQRSNTKQNRPTDRFRNIQCLFSASSYDETSFQFGRCTNWQYDLCLLSSLWPWEITC